MAAPRACPECGTELAPALLACPACRRLVHRERLEELARGADEAELRGERDAALLLWREAQGLLPPDSAQSRGVAERVTRLLRAGARDPAAAPRHSPLPKWLAPLGVLGLLLWKFKFLLAFALTKGKLLLLGLTQASTFFSMILSVGVYWAAWGWRFALGFVLAMYVHEMGHVAALSRLGIPFSAPMFIPGLGAVVRAGAYPTTPREDAQVGLAGPLWGLGAAVAALALGHALAAPYWLAIAHVAGLLNLFNLLPVWQLDGARGFHPLSREQRLWAAAALGVAWAATHDGLLFVVALVAFGRALFDPRPGEGDRRTLVEFVLITLALAAVVHSATP